MKSFACEVRSSWGVVNSAIVKAAAKGIILAKDANLLQENGGDINLTKDWANQLLARMGYVERKAATKAIVSLAHFDSLKAQFLSDIRTIVVMESIPPELIINWDHTGIKYVPVSCWTLEKKGSKHVEIAGVDDKRQFTALLAGTLAGQFLPAQLIYAGKTPACMPKTSFPSDGHVTFTPNQWSNEDTMLAYIENVIVPYVVKMRSTLKLPHSQSALAIFDHFERQLILGFRCLWTPTKSLPWMYQLNVQTVYSPWTSGINKPFKDHMKASFQMWYTQQVCLQLQQKQMHKAVDLKLSVRKPLSANFLMAAFIYVQNNPDLVKNGFRDAGISAALS